MYIKEVWENKLLTRIGRFCFNSGIFLMPGAFIYSATLLLISFIIANLKSRNLLKDKWNYPLIICSLLMIIVCLISSFYPTTYYEFTTNKNLNWIGLVNWIPMFWVYWCAQYYLKNAKERRTCGLYLVLGSIPVLISGFGQYYFNWYGPIKFLNETIIWYQRENTYPVFTGPFNNPNYAGTWLTVIFPFSLFFFLESTKIKLNKIFFSLTTISLFLAIFLTQSRNAILNLFIAFTLLIGISIKTLLIIFLIFMVFISSIFIFEIPSGSFSFFSENKIISSFLPKTDNFNGILSFNRIKIWKTAISNIISNPFIGWGASSFSIVYLLKNDLPTYQHSHNLILEIANNYGVIICLILFNMISLLMYKSISNLSKQKDYIFGDFLINKFWWVSTLVILLMQLNDISYYDGRISLLFWILISGVRSILREINDNKSSIN